MPRTISENAELRQNRKTQILEATCRCLREKSFASLTIKEVAQEAGVAYGLVHYYFNSKEQLLRETVAFLLGYFQRIALEETAKLEQAPLTKASFLAFFRRYHERLFLSETAYYEWLWFDLSNYGRFDEGVRAVLASTEYTTQVSAALERFFSPALDRRKVYHVLMTYMEGMNVLVNLYGDDAQEIIARGEEMLSFLFDHLALLAGGTEEKN